MAKANGHLSQTEENRACLAIVLATGKGYYNEETKEEVDLDYKPGNLILLSQHGIKAFTEFPGLMGYTSGDIGLTQEHEIHMAWDDVEAYEKYKQLLNS